MTYDEVIDKILEILREEKAGIRNRGKGNIFMNNISIGRPIIDEGEDSIWIRNLVIQQPQQYQEPLITILNELEKEKPDKNVIQKSIDALKKWIPIGVKIYEILKEYGLIFS